MSDVGEIERRSQNRVAKLFQNTLGYKHLGFWDERPNNSNIEKDDLRDYLIRRGHSPVLADRAIQALDDAARDQSKSFYDLNYAVYEILRYGANVLDETGDHKKTIPLINWDEPLTNDFAIAEEVTVKGQYDKRPDIVLYVNGIALGVLELKRSTRNVSHGIRQNLINQNPEFIQSFFATIQLVMGGNDTEGLRYGVIETEEKYYLTWKEAVGNGCGSLVASSASPILANPVPSVLSTPSPSSADESILDRDLINLCSKQRFLEIIHDFIVFDAGTKKICRPNQYFAVKFAQEFLKRREGGIVWDTQGSGKSLIMVWLAKWIRENIDNSRVLIITDRDDLDKQIEKVFKGVDEDMVRTKSGEDLFTKLNQANPALLCSLIHKFGARDEGDIPKYVADLRANLPKNFAPQGDIYIFVDECHRTQSGKLHDAMRDLLPNAVIIGFTGTPLLKDDKKKSIEIFGPYIHCYKYPEAVADKVVLDLRYEARDIEQELGSPERIDKWFENRTRGLNEYGRSKLKQRWGNLQTLYSAKSRLEKIVNDILMDMDERPRLSTKHGNAMLVAGSIYQACQFYDLFQLAGFTQCAIVTSYDPTVAGIKDEDTGAGITEKSRQYEIYNKMLNGKTVEKFEEEVKKQFIKQPGQMRLLIVVDKLLTGFDAPPATYLYIDKKMQDHGLFQAICRVNRLDGEDKEYGFIVDYQDLFQSLKRSMQDYTSGAFAKYDKSDVEGLLTDRIAQAQSRLEETRESIKAVCEPVAPPKNRQDYLRYFCGEDTTDPEGLQKTFQKRQALYKQSAALIRAYANLAGDLEKTTYTPTQLENIDREVTHYTQVREEVKIASGENIDLKAYEPDMRQLIDAYVRAQDSKIISRFDDLTLIQLIVEQGVAALDELPPGIRKDREAVAETIERNIRKLIIDEQPVNPKYYEKMSELLTELIEKRRAEAIAYEVYLDQVVELAKQAKNPNAGNTYPNSLDTPAKRALFDNLGKDEAVAIAVHEAVTRTRQANFRDNLFNQRAVKAAITEFIPAGDLDRIFELIKNQTEY